MDRTFIEVDGLVDGAGGSSSLPMRIEIADGRIASVRRRSADEPVSTDCAVWQFPGHTAIPGLIDVHSHFSLFADGRSYEEMATDSDERMAIAAVRNLALHLQSGVTTARDNGARRDLGFAIREAVASGLAAGPRVLTSGRPVTPSGGHFSWCGGAADGVEQVRSEVRKLIAQGADHIKIMASGGGTLGTDPGRACYSLDEVGAAVRTASGLGRLVTAHCRATEAMKIAIDAHAECIEHGEFLEADGTMRYDREVAKQLCDSGTYLSPTLQASGWDTIMHLRRKNELCGLSREETNLLRLSEEETRTRLTHIRALVDEGHGPRILAGTDAGCYDFSFGHIDYCLGLLVAAGMSAHDALLSATGRAATACGVDGELGSIAAGKRADVVILAGSPLEAIENVSRVRAVFKDGELAYESTDDLSQCDTSYIGAMNEIASS